MKSYTLFEKIFQELRIRQVLRYIPRGGVLVDLGCDQPQVLIDRVRADMKVCIGVDIAVQPHKDGNVKVIRQAISKKISIPSNSAHVITMLAVLEHLKYPEEIVKECNRILKKGGVLLITVPSPANKPVLELFAKLGLVRREMIEQHENYFTKPRLKKICKEAKFRIVTAENFEFGFNTFVKAVK